MGESRFELVHILDQVFAERVKQDVKWGEQNHPDGTGPDIRYAFDGTAAEIAGMVKDVCQRRDAAGDDLWSIILLEEVFEALAEEDPARLREELIQSAAVAVAWVEAIDRRGGRMDG